MHMGDKELVATGHNYVILLYLFLKGGQGLVQSKIQPIE